MKKLLLALALVFILLSCDNGDVEKEKNPLIGTWEDSNENFIETFEFTDNEIIATYQDLRFPNSEPIITRGVYQRYDTVIIFRMEIGHKFFADYSISGKKLTMTFSHTGNTVIYTKK